MTFGKAAEDAVLKKAEKLKLTGLKEKAIAGLLAQQAADTAVNTPITVVAGLANGKGGKGIVKDIGKQVAVDAAFNVGLEGLNTIGGIRRAKKAQKKIPQQIENSLIGGIQPNEYIKLGETPEILKRFGMIDGEMRIPQRVVPKAAYPVEYRQVLARGEGLSERAIKDLQGHNLGFEAIRQLPERMRNPVAILKSDTQKDSIVVWTDMLDASGRPVIVPIRAASDETTDFGTVIPSMYGRKEFAEFIEKQGEKGNILYYDKKRDLQQLPNSGLQLPESFNADADPMLRIAQRKEKVNKEELENVKPGNKLAQAELQQLALQAYECRKKKQ